MSKPNILFLIAEDMCPNLGCYGDLDAITPNLDALADEGMRYDHVSSVGPVCSAARTALALGLYPATAGVGNHRSHVEVPEYVRIFSEYMQEVGYYTAINKTDYNFRETYVDGNIRGWDTIIDSPFFQDSEVLAETLSRTWNQRPKGSPFFFMHTFAVTHQSKYGYPGNPEEHRRKIIPRTMPEHYRDRSKLHIPAYHTDNPDTREIWGQYHECITAMDRMVGETLDLLKVEGLYEDTIIFFFGDNGMGVPGGKFTMWDEGNKVPLLVRVPEKYKHLIASYEAGGFSREPVDFVDFAPTALNLAGARRPDHLQGRDFLNISTKDHRETSFSYRNRIDSSGEVIRSVKDGRYLYIRNFYPQKGWRYSPYMAYCSPYFMVSNEKDIKAKYTYVSEVNRQNAFYMSTKPIEELYDLVQDPDQMDNLALQLAFKPMVKRMRQDLRKWMIQTKDGGLMMEQELKGLCHGSTAYEVLRDQNHYPIEDILAVTDSMLEDGTSIDILLTWLKDENATIRYWAVQAIYAKGDYTKTVAESLYRCLEDMSPMVQLAAAETIIYAGTDGTQDAQDLIQQYLLNREDILLPLEALEILDRMGHRLDDLMPLTEDLMHHSRLTDEADVDRYERAVTTLARLMSEKWHQRFDYTELEEGAAERLLIFRELREKNDLYDLAIG